MSRTRGHRNCGRVRCGICTGAKGKAVRLRELAGAGDIAAEVYDLELTGYDDWGCYDPGHPDSYESRC